MTGEWWKELKWFEGIGKYVNMVRIKVGRVYKERKSKKSVKRSGTGEVVNRVDERARKIMKREEKKRRRQ